MSDAEPALPAMGVDVGSREAVDAAHAAAVRAGHEIVYGPVDEPWEPPAVLDALSGEPVRLTGDGVVTVLGLHRVGAVEEALRAAPAADVTAVLVSGQPAELLPLARLVVADLRRCLRAAVPEGAWPRLRIVLDPSGEVAAATGTTAVGDATEAAVRIAGGRVVARAEGHGAGHAAATAS